MYIDGNRLVALPTEPHPEKEAAIRAYARERGAGLVGAELHIGSAFKRYLIERGWRFRILAAHPDPDVPGTTAYLLRVKSAPAGIEA